MPYSPELEKAVLALPSMQGVESLNGVTHVKCLNADSYYNLAAGITNGVVYEVVEWQEGIFSDRPYIVINNHVGREVNAHASRFQAIN